MYRSAIIPMTALMLMGVSCSQAPDAASKGEPGKAQGGAEELKYGIRVQSGPMDSILLKDYKPASSLVVPETMVPKAKYPVIDIHTHTFMNGIKTPEDVAAWVRTMDEVGIERSVVFTGATGADFDKQVEDPASSAA